MALLLSRLLLRKLLSRTGGGGGQAAAASSCADGVPFTLQFSGVRLKRGRSVAAAARAAVRISQRGSKQGRNPSLYHPPRVSSSRLCRSRAACAPFQIQAGLHQWCPPTTRKHPAECKERYMSVCVGVGVISWSVGPSACKGSMLAPTAACLQEEHAACH